MKRILLLSALFCCGTASFATPVTLSLPKTDAAVTLSWNEGYFGAQPSTEYHHEIARLACALSDIAYADVLASPDTNELYAAYKKLGVRESDIEAHYDINYTDAMWGNDQCAFSIASRTIASAQGSRTLVFVTIRGTPMNAHEWLSNLNVNDLNKEQESIHKGFARAANIVNTALISYLLRHRIDPTDAFLLITGHSRGGAVANILSPLILEDNFFKRENIYVYTFAAPNVTTEPDATDERYGFIWNIVNAEDIVPTVPMNRGNWLFHKFGRTRALVNRANTPEALYKDDYLKRINAFYQQIIGRDYKPFTTGPFLPVIVTTIFTYVNKDVSRYYSGAKNLHNKAADLMNKLFPEKKELDDEEKVEEHKGNFGSWLLSWLNRRTGGMLDYAALALGDMHINEVYLSYMLALEENEAFSETDYAVTIIQGSAECAVYDSVGTLMARVIDGKIFYSDMRFPVILCPGIGNRVFIGCPVVDEYSVVLTDETLLTTPTPVTTEFFDAAGVFQRSEKQTLYPRRNRVLRFAIGKKLVETRTVSAVQLAKTESRDIIINAGLLPRERFQLIPEIYTNSDWNAGFALHAGTSRLFFSAMTAQGLTKLGRAAELAAGVGNQQSIIGRLKCEGEFLAKGIWLEAGNDEDRFLLVPEARAGLSIKLIGRLSVFAAGVADVEISGFNEDAFKTNKRTTTISSFKLTDSVRLAPSVQFGVRF